MELERLKLEGGTFIVVYLIQMLTLQPATVVRPREEIEPQDPEMVRRAIAHSLFPQLAYQYGLYVGAD